MQSADGIRQRGDRRARWMCVLLAGTAFVGAAMLAAAQDATWLPSPPSNIFNALARDLLCWAHPTQTPQKNSGPPTDAGATKFCAINTGAQWLTVSRISATSSTDPAVVDPVSCRLGA
jgi:hypothetical protein